jgi:hypothetical protein
MKNKFYYGLVFAFWLVYVFLSFNAPQTNTSNQFGLTETSITIIRITFILPYLIIWWLALYGALSLRTYAKTIHGNPDSKGLLFIGNGLTLLLVSMIVSSVLGGVRSLYIYDLNIIPPLTIIDNYVATLIPLAAFYYIFTGSSYLIRNTKTTTVALQKQIIASIPLVIFSIIYIWLLFTNPNRQVAYSADTPASFYLPDAIILLTIVVPVVLTWTFGSLGALNIWHFMENTKGIIYKQFLKYVVYGIVAVITGSVIIQALVSLGTGRLLTLGLGPLLLVIYVFLIIQGLGFVLISLGVKKLTRIETV